MCRTSVWFLAAILALGSVATVRAQSGPDTQVVFLNDELAPDSNGNFSGEFYPLVNKKVHFTIVSDIYNHMLNEDNIYIKINQDTVTIFPNQAVREGFRITMVDFYRLVDMF